MYEGGTQGQNQWDYFVYWGKWVLEAEECATSYFRPTSRAESKEWWQIFECLWGHSLRLGEQQKREWVIGTMIFSIFIFTGSLL